MDENLEWRIRTFFNYWRQRYQFIRDLDLSKHHHEANVLLWAALDALSNLWAENIGKQQCDHPGKRLIFDAFLARYGGELFQIVSLPDVWSRVDRKDVCVDRNNKRKLPEDICTFLSRVGNRSTIALADADRYQLRRSSDDWSLDKIIAETSQTCPTTNRAELEKWLIFSRYGAIAYKEMRSAYIHEGRAGKGAHGFDLSESAQRPTYLSGIYTTPPSIGFSVEFMLGALERCVSAFEDDALSLQQDPVPNEV